VAASPGTAVQFEVTGDTTGAWSIVAGNSGWEVHAGETSAPACVIRTSADMAWRLLFNALSPEQIGERLSVTGDASLVVPLLRARSVIV
jgi:hypothetical protein